MNNHPGSGRTPGSDPLLVPPAADSRVDRSKLDPRNTRQILHRDVAFRAPFVVNTPPAAQAHSR